jgi:predicted esterase
MSLRHALALSVLCLLAPTFADSGEGPEPQPTGRLVEGVSCSRDPTQTYTLYLPPSYSAQQAHPALLIFDPRGRATMAAELFREAAETYGWILMSSNDTRSDGPMEPNRRALDALWPEVHERYAVDHRRIYAAGFSGGAMLALELGKVTGGLAGVIGAGGRIEPEKQREEISFPHFGAVGDTDFNFLEMRRVDALLESWGTPHRLEVFVGPHRWMPPELATRAVEWMEVQAMRHGLRKVNGELVAELIRGDLEGAQELEAAGDPLAAMRRLRAITATYDGVGPAAALAAAGEKADRLAAADAVRAAEKDEQRWDRWQESTLRRAWKSLELLQDPEAAPPLGQIFRRLGLERLKEQAGEESYAGGAAGRVLEKLFVQLAFYQTRDLMAAGNYERAAQLLTISAEIKPERHGVWYILACAQARSGHPKPALEALERAIDSGFRDLDHLQSDPDLQSIRKRDGYQRLVARLRG